MRWNQLPYPLLCEHQVVAPGKHGLMVGYWDSPGGARMDRARATALAALTFTSVAKRHLPIITPEAPLPLEVEIRSDDGEIKVETSL